MSTALTLLADEEVRVRQAAGELLGAFCQKFGPRVYEECQAHVFELIKTNLDRCSEISDLEGGLCHGVPQERTEERA